MNRTSPAKAGPPPEIVIGMDGIEGPDMETGTTRKLQVPVQVWRRTRSKAMETRDGAQGLRSRLDIVEQPSLVPDVPTRRRRSPSDDYTESPYKLALYWFGIPFLLIILLTVLADQF